MSNVSNSFDFDFWEFVACGRCQLPYNAPSGPSIPFWLTECGHVLCNNHLNVDQSCSQCGAHQIQLMPLQQEMEPPMSQWFQSIPIWLDSVAFAAKFQLESMAAQIRFYKLRHQQQRALVERLKREISELKMLQNSTPMYSNVGPGDGYLQQHQLNSREFNGNGKRLLVEDEATTHLQKRPPQTRSSPLTPGGPDRITLGQTKQAPMLVPEQVGEFRVSRSSNGGTLAEAGYRPSTSLTAQYAYNPPSTSQFHPQPMSRTQAAPQSFKRVDPPPSQSRNRAGPPPTPGYHTGQNRRILTQRGTNAVRSQQAMGPPPMPQGNRLKPAQMVVNPNAFQPQASSVGRGPQRFVPQSTKENTGPDSSGNRMRFAPSSANNGL